MVITTHDELNLLINRLQVETAYVHPVVVDMVSHKVKNQIAVLNILFDDDTFFTVSTQHPDAPSFNVDLTTCYKLITMYKKELLHLAGGVDNIIDIATIIQFNNDTPPQIAALYPPAITQLMQRFRFSKLPLAVPLTSWSELGLTLTTLYRDMYRKYQPTENTEAFRFTNDTVIPTLATIELAGLWTTDNQYVYSDYNIYTSTGRPSNAFGGINFAALNKQDGSRDRFVSRFGADGVLVQFDYEAFHLRLAANTINYTLPETSVHTFLAQQYYGTPDITDEMYEESKARTFALMYGQTDDTGDVEFFQRLKEYSSVLWDTYRQDGFVLSGSGRRVVVTEPTKNKVFNYLMQLTETEEALKRIRNVCAFLAEYQSRVILYTYDAILLDVPTAELDLMVEVTTLLNTGGYPVRQYRGNNYNNLILHKI